MNLLEDDIKRLIIVHRYITSNLHGDLSIDVLCEKITVSRSTLKRHFAAYFKKSIHEFILEQRLYKALELLCSKKKNVSEIASDVGYNDRRSFTRAFNKFFGRPPTDCFKDSEQ